MKLGILVQWGVFNLLIFLFNYAKRSLRHSCVWYYIQSIIQMIKTWLIKKQECILFLENMKYYN